MRVTVDLTPAVQGHAGLGRYAEELARALLACRPEGEELRAFYNDPQRRAPAPPLDTLPRRTLPWSSKPWRMLVLLAQLSHMPQNALVGQTDVFLATQHLLPRVAGAISIFTLHDLIFRYLPEAHLPLNRWFLNLAVPRFLAAADAIIAVSECTRRDAITFYRIPEQKIHVVYEGANERFKPVQDAEKLSAIRKRYGLPDRFLLYVGTIEPRKNLGVLFEAFRASGVQDLKLVIAGKKGWLYDETFARLQELGIEQDILFTGFVADEDLPGLYSLAIALAFPSLYEGFGLPALEAMSCGTPVISSDTSSLPEVVGEAGILLAPGDVQGWAEAIRHVASNAELRFDLRTRGLNEASRFSWTKAAAETRALYREVYARRR